MRAALFLVRLTSSYLQLKGLLLMRQLTFPSIVSQNTSWSCLNVSLQSISSIIDTLGFSDNIYDVVQAFRRKISDTEQFRWSACRGRLDCPQIDRFGQSSSRRSISR